jgi:hypothetical protein
MAQPSRAISIDAPIGGWNAFDSLDNMPPDSAVELINLIPNAGSVDTRKGSRIYGDTLTGLPVETVASLDTDSEIRMVAASAGGVFDIDPLGVVVEIEPVGTFGNDRWQTANFRRIDEVGVLIMCNGVDEVHGYTYPDPPPATFDPLIFTYVEGPDDDPTPLDPDQEPQTPFIGVLNFKGRCYYWSDNSDEFWYCAAGSYQGQMRRFNLGAIAQKGGKLKFIASWTQQDAGDGRDDFLVFVMSTGEILVYQGDDPQSVGFFEMVGRYKTAQPLSIRGSGKYGSDTVIMTKDGYVALSTIIQQGRTSDVPQFSRLIDSAIEDRTRYGSSWYGWDCELFSEQGLFVFNVPLFEGATQFEQHVLNTVTMKWCKFDSINVNCLGIYDDRLLGGDSVGRVIAINEGFSDIGEPITFAALPAFNYLGDAGNQKFISAAQIISTHGDPSLIELTGASDFNVKLPSVPLSPESRESAVWSINPALPPVTLGSFWDEDYWGVAEDAAATTKGWQNVTAYGYAVTVIVRFKKINSGVKWRSTGIRFTNAGAQ